MIFIIIYRLADAFDRHKASLMEAAADDAGFPLKITSIEVEKTDIPDLKLFGPFLLLIPFDDIDRAASELIQIRYGFFLTFLGSVPEKIRNLFHSHFGMVYDNPDFIFTPLRLPFGGKKASGWILDRHGDQWLERDGAFLYSKELSEMGGLGSPEKGQPEN